MPRHRCLSQGRRVSSVEEQGQGGSDGDGERAGGRPPQPGLGAFQHRDSPVPDRPSLVGVDGGGEVAETRRPASCSAPTPPRAPSYMRCPRPPPWSGRRRTPPRRCRDRRPGRREIPRTPLRHPDPCPRRRPDWTARARGRGPPPSAWSLPLPSWGRSTPTRSAVSMSRARSPPESCTAPRPGAVARRPVANSSRVSAISSMVCDPMHPIGIEQRLVDRIVTGQRLAVGSDGCLALWRLAPTLRATTGTSRLSAADQRRTESLRVTDRLEKQGDDTGRVSAQGPFQIAVHAGVDLETGRDHEVEPDAAPVVEQGGEQRSGVTEEGDPPGAKIWRLIEAAHPKPGFDVEKAHPVAAADRDAGVRSDVVEPAAERCAVCRLPMATGEDRRPSLLRSWPPAPLPAPDGCWPRRGRPDRPTRQHSPGREHSDARAASRSRDSPGRPGPRSPPRSADAWSGRRPSPAAHWPRRRRPNGRGASDRVIHGHELILNGDSAYRRCASRATKHTALCQYPSA